MLNVENIKPFCLEDIFTIISILNKIDFDFNIFKGKSEEELDKMAPELGTDMLKQLFSKSINAKENIYTLISSITGLTKDECKKLNILELRQLGKKVMEINNLHEVFTQVHGLM